MAGDPGVAASFWGVPEGQAGSLEPSEPQLIGPTQPMVATRGDDITLPCHLAPATDLSDITLEWARPDLDPRFVLVRRSGQELEGKQHQSFKGRTSLFTDELKNGNVSLKLSNVKIPDGGTYRCFIPELQKDSFVQLVVGAASSPDIIIAGLDELNESYKSSSGLMLDCKSAGWYPEPEVLWLDAEGNLLSAGPTESVRGPDDLYTVSSRVTVEKRHSNSFTCRVQQNNINQTREVHIHLPDEFFVSPCSSAALIAVFMESFKVVRGGAAEEEEEEERRRSGGGEEEKQRREEEERKRKEEQRRRKEELKKELETKKTEVCILM
ncbi:butyrophilin subfamily 2 member A1-like [Brachyistius frenatus]|uniref:butyrophilin subfamily 2 member A1-like n=1 Tax=Brachyistius frenatus TaxID=100188 RepID=UPI0037E92A46